MSSWGERMASVVTSCGPRQNHPGLPYHRRLEKVKFGVPLDQVCKRDIPGPLLVMLLKLNKEGPFKKDVFRAPGHQGNMRKLIHFLQQGRLVNIQSFSVNTIASVLKKFLRKVPGGIFGPENEAELFTIIKMDTEEEKLALVQRIFLSLPIYSQHLLVLLFGTFRVIHSNCKRAKTGMTAEALGVSVAPSFFHTCVSEGKIARPEEVQKFKEFFDSCQENVMLATKIVTFFIEHFGMRDLFGRENYEYYARLTGRILKVEDEWIFFTAPWIFPNLADEGTMVQQDPSSGPQDATNERFDRNTPSRISDPGVVHVDVHTVHIGGKGLVEQKTGSLEIIPENCPLDPNGRLSTSLDDQNVSSPSSCGSQSCYHHRFGDFRTQTLGRPAVGLGRCSESRGMEDHSNVVRKQAPGRGHEVKTKNHTCLPQVHQRQTERMKHRSEWFLSDPTGLVTVKCRPDRPASLGPSSGTSAAQVVHDATSPVAIDISGSVSLPITSIGALHQHDTLITSSNLMSSTASYFTATTRSPLPSTLLTATSATPTRSRSPSNRLPISLLHSPSTGTTSISTPSSQPVVCDTIPISSTQSSIPPFMTFSSSRKLHQHFANQAAAYSTHTNVQNITPPIFQSTPQATHLSSVGPSAGIVSTDHHSFLQSMIKSQSPIQLPATQTSIVSGNATLTQQQLPHATHSFDIPMSIAQPSSTTPTTSSTSRNNGSNNVRLRRRLSDKDKERRLVRRSSSKRKDKENGGDAAVHVAAATSSGSLDKFGSSGALTGAESGESGPPSIGSINTGVGGIGAIGEGSHSTPSKPRGAQLRRAGSADAGGANVVTGSTSPRSAAHALLCRTGSQDNPHVEGYLSQGGGVGSCTDGVSSSATSPLTKSLPRI